jgi:signal transduction histidine kinase
VRLGIGARITALFGLGALLLSIAMGGIAYFTTRHFLLAGRESAAQHQTFTNAFLIRSQLVSPSNQCGSSGSSPYTTLLACVDSGTTNHSVLYVHSTPYEDSLSVTWASIPEAERRVVLAGTAATQTYRTTQGAAEIVVGVPIPSVQATYFEVFDLSDLDHTLRVLGLTLFGAGVVTTLLGITLGRFASRRTLRPLTDVSRAAGAIAGGELDTRLDADAADPDLEDLTKSFNTMVDQLQERIQREARFTSDVSHELRSPLTTLSASLEVLEAGRDRLPDRSQRALVLLGDDLRRFQRMVADLLEMSRADAGSGDVFLEEVDVVELVERSVDAGLSQRNGHAPDVWRRPLPAVRVDPGVRAWRVGVDKRRFERVMVNLLENADHYGGGAVAVGVRPGGDETVEVTVDDAGPGIEPRERAAVFDRFYRGSASGRRGAGTGTGLGLALVAEHMRVMHGSVRVETSPQGGARFVLTLPVLMGMPDAEHAGVDAGDAGDAT